jgi:histone-lysine N-methyltransferase SETMAR
MYQELKSIQDSPHNMGKYAGEVMLTLSWGSQGVILEHYLERDTTVNSVRYSEMLSTKLKPAIRTKRRGLLSTGVLLLHDNACPHTAIHTVQTLLKVGFEVLDHPAYSPDLAATNSHLFGPLKDALRSRRFTSEEEVKEAVHERFTAQSKTFFSAAIQKLVQPWNKCI